MVKIICGLMDEMVEVKPEGVDQFEDLITYVKDRPGHDLRYAIDASKINEELGWSPSVTFEQGLGQTIDWYLENQAWLSHVTSGEYRDYYREHYKLHQG